jgi:HAD superfamily hydrolase (TIGR01509 family)
MKRAALLDVDGTLVDSNDLHAEAWVEALRDQGFAHTFEELRPLIGMGGDKLIPLLSGLDPDSEEGERLSAHRSEVFLTRYLPRVRAFPDARRLLEMLLQRGHALCVATSAKREEVEALLRQGELLDLLPQRTSADDAEQSKPDPDIVKAALQKLGVSAAHAVMLGDTPYDAEAAQRARVAFIGFTCGGYAAPALGSAQAVYGDPADLVAHFAASPLAG